MTITTINEVEQKKVKRQILEIQELLKDHGIKKPFNALVKRVSMLHAERDLCVQLGTFDGYIDERKDGNMYLRSPQVNGHRPSPVYVGKKPERQAEARAMLDRQTRAEHIDRELNELSRRFRLVIKNYQYILDTLDQTQQVRMW